MTGDCPSCKDGVMMYGYGRVFLTYPSSTETTYICNKCGYEIKKYKTGRRMEDYTMAELEG